MSGLRRSTRKRSSASIAGSEQIAEIVANEEEEKQKELAGASPRADDDDDAEYRPVRKPAANAAIGEIDEKHTEDRPAKRRNSNGSSATDNLAENEAETQQPRDDAVPNQRGSEVGPVSERARFLQAGTHTAVQQHASALFELAKVAETASPANAASISFAVADGQEEKVSASSPSASSSSSDNGEAAGSADSKDSEPRQAAAERADGVNGFGSAACADSPALLPHQEDAASGLSPDLLGLNGPRVRGLSRSPSPGRPAFSALLGPARGISFGASDGFAGNEPMPALSLPEPMAASASAEMAAVGASAERDHSQAADASASKVRRPTSIVDSDRERMVLAVHVLLVGSEDTPDPPLNRLDVLHYVNEVLLKTTMSCPVNWFGRLFAQALAEECDLDGCTIDHSRDLLQNGGKTLGAVRLSRPSDFLLRKQTRQRQQIEPACAAAYRALVPHAPRLCASALDPEHDHHECDALHLPNLVSSEPLDLSPSPGLQSRAVRLVLERCVERARRTNGNVDAKAKVRSAELVDLMENYLASSDLLPAIRSKRCTGGFFSRHGMGRAISNSPFWGDVGRNAKSRSFPGYKINPNKPDVDTMRRQLAAEFGSAPASAPAPAVSAAERKHAETLPPVPEASDSAVQLSAEQYALLLGSARAHLRQQQAAAVQRTAQLDAQIASLMAQRTAVATSAERSAAMLSRF